MVKISRSRIEQHPPGDQLQPLARAVHSIHEALQGVWQAGRGKGGEEGGGAGAGGGLGWAGGRCGARCVCVVVVKVSRKEQRSPGGQLQPLARAVHFIPEVLRGVWPAGQGGQGGVGESRGGQGMWQAGRAGQGKARRSSESVGADILAGRVSSCGGVGGGAEAIVYTHSRLVVSMQLPAWLPPPIAMLLVSPLVMHLFHFVLLIRISNAACLSFTNAYILLLITNQHISVANAAYCLWV